MKNVLALSLSLLMPVAPVLAQTPPNQVTPTAATGQTPQSGATDQAPQPDGTNQAPQPDATGHAPSPAATSASINNTAQALDPDQHVAPTVGTGQAPPTDPSGAPPDAATAVQPSPNLRTSLANVPNPPDPPEKKPSFFSKLKANVMGFASKHPVVTGAILGGLLCIAGGPAIFVIGVSLGAVAGDMTSYMLKKLKKSDS